MTERPVLQAEESPRAPATTSLQVRQGLVDALRLDLIGPEPGGPHAEERIDVRYRPSFRYLTGFLVPSETSAGARDAEEDDDFDSEVAAGGLAEESTPQGKRSKRRFFPSSIGLSFLVSPEAAEITVTATWGDYARGEVPSKTDGKPRPVWVRSPRREQIRFGLTSGGPSRKEPPRVAIPGSGGLGLCINDRLIPTEGLGGTIPEGTRAVSVFLVNNRPPAEDRDVAYAFQARLSITCGQPFPGRPDLTVRQDASWDDRVAQLHYADRPSFATGHGVAADWTIEDGVCTEVRTRWLAEAEVEATKPRTEIGTALSMAELGALSGGEAARSRLQPLVHDYRAWIEAEAKRAEALPQYQDETATVLLQRANGAAARIERGIETLATDPDALDAFRLANRAVARALERRSGLEDPAWRPFQLAFLLLNLKGMADPDDAVRDAVDLLFFPTGGGKTEAYLGLAAFAMVLRRLRHPGQDGRAGAGVSVIMRYTLRLLTLDQLSRAAGLVCALELERQQDPGRYGAWPFEIGLWVGKGGTPNRMGRKGDKGRDTARAKTLHYKGNPGSDAQPIPLEKCPWCSTPFTPESFSLVPNADDPSDLRIVCTHWECEFSGDQSLPIVAIDDPLYRRLPAFLIATVDKFAALPWEGRSGLLLGGADRFDTNGFYGPATPGRGSPLGAPLPPPDLIIQDELHLISGPLGTMMGLYETVIDALCTAPRSSGAGDTTSANGSPAARPIKPKIVASTATARQATEQVQAVFGRGLTHVFPPPGPRREDSFFALTRPAAEVPARQYVGLAAAGRNQKAVMRRVLLILMGSAQRAFNESGGYEPGNPADPYMTTLAYFNSLRELGGARRIVEEEVQMSLRNIGLRGRVGERRGLFRDRTLGARALLELTSRVSTSDVARAFDRLGRGFDEKGRVDCALATNMISVGLDVPRLGLMVVNGQPKTHAEYIQVTSRVGRSDDKPGLVVTLLNIYKPRDRSHYERFRHYHETFYRSLEPASTTPFAARALDRGLAGAVVALARHSDPSLTPPRGVKSLRDVRSQLERHLCSAFHDRLQHQQIEDSRERAETEEAVRSSVVDLLDSWLHVVEANEKSGAELAYQRYEAAMGHKPFLRYPLETDYDSDHHRKFRVYRSLRDVEPEVQVNVRPLPPTGHRPPQRTSARKRSE